MKNNLQQMKERGEKMPKLKINESELRCRTLRGCIKNAQEIQGINTIKTAELTGYSGKHIICKTQKSRRFQFEGT